MGSSMVQLRPFPPDRCGIETKVIDEPNTLGRGSGCLSDAAMAAAHGIRALNTRDALGVIIAGEELLGAARDSGQAEKAELIRVALVVEHSKLEEMMAESTQARPLEKAASVCASLYHRLNATRASRTYSGVPREIGVGAAHWLAPLPPPNRTGGSPASGSPVRAYRRAD